MTSILAARRPPAVALYVLVGLLSQARADGQAPADVCALTVTGRIASENVQPSLTLAADTGGTQYCAAAGKADELCTIRVSCSTTEAVFTVTATNFKRYRRNIPIAGITARAATIDLGQIQLQASELPVVVSVIRASTAAQAARFQIVMHNPLKREVFVRSIALSASRVKPFSACMSNSSSVYEISDSIELTSSGGELAARGSFQETAKGAGLSVTADGTLSESRCGGTNELRLNLPTAFTLSPMEYSAVDIVLPARFLVKTTRSLFGAGEKPIPLTVDTTAFSGYEFRFTTDRDDELQIVGTYGTGLGRSTQPGDSLAAPRAFPRLPGIPRSTSPDRTP